jgi:DNA-binding NtrC family response regulator
MAARILLTEDDEDVRDLLELVLAERGYQVDATDTVSGALSFLDSRSYDLLFTDGMLPDGSGLTIADTAKQRDIKVVFFTGFADAFPAEELARYTVLHKPTDMANVVQTVAHIIAA